MDRAHPRLGRRASVLLASALAWGVALMAAAAVLPVWTTESSSTSATTSGAHVVTTTESTSSTLVHATGYWVLLVVGIPALVAATVWMALRRRCSRGDRASGILAWTAIGALASICVLGMLTVGVFIAPVVGLLAVAARLTPPGAPPAVFNRP